MPRFAANLSMLYNDVDFLDRFAAAARDGFKAVEYLFPYAYPAQELATRLQANGLQGKVIEVDAYGWVTQLIANFKANGFAVSNTAQACDASKTPDDTSLLCSPATYVAPDADQTYMFADDLHPTTHLHTLFAQFVEQQIAQSGLGH